jgi:hypothetical protein
MKTPEQIMLDLIDRQIKGVLGNIARAEAKAKHIQQRIDEYVRRLMVLEQAQKDYRDKSD